VSQTNAARQKPWASLISFTASQKVLSLFEGAVAVRVCFVLRRPKKHYTTKGLRADAPTYHTSATDLDKLVRLVLDALTGIVYRDDAQVAQIVATKQYGDAPGASVEVEEI
jgi:Holliday junction resolvase RusA-like endonuclease